MLEPEQGIVAEKLAHASVNLTFERVQSYDPFNAARRRL
jgi:hypothetical protein